MAKKKTPAQRPIRNPELLSFEEKQEIYRDVDRGGTYNGIDGIVERTGFTKKQLQQIHDEFQAYLDDPKNYIKLYRWSQNDYMEERKIELNFFKWNHEVCEPDEDEEEPMEGGELIKVKYGDYNNWYGFKSKFFALVEAEQRITKNIEQEKEHLFKVQHQMGKYTKLKKALAEHRKKTK